MLLDPRLDVVSAAPLAEFAEPFEAAAARGLLLLLAVALLATLLAAVLTRRMTRRIPHPHIGRACVKHRE